ncbi:MAG: hypothetical protein E5Y76_00705 [Mesorhizobium sp.]|nr:MAG: hypothetical protein E5Y76_00705 [Mesorhizobium sp.]
MRGAPAWHQQHSVQHPSTVSALRADPPSPTRGEGKKDADSPFADRAWMLNARVHPYHARSASVGRFRERKNVRLQIRFPARNERAWFHPPDFG